jgi:cell division protease FtsH
MGHAIVGHFLEHSDPVHKISIISRGQALGYTISMPQEDRFLTTKAELTDNLAMTLGGRAAEEIVFGETSSGAESDIEQLTAIARQMVGRWGMSPAIGPIAVLPRDGAGPLLPGAEKVSPRTQQLIDEEVRRVVEEAHKEVTALLKKNRKRLDSLANALLEHETLDEEDAYAAAEVPRATTSASESYSTAARSRDGR